MARMSTLLIVGAVTVAVGAGVVYYGYKKGVFKFASYFKTENMMVYPPLPNDTFNRPDNKRLLLGVYDEKANEINKALLIIADAFDEKTLEVLGNESLVVLS